jgi:hypothetical protein
MPNNAKLLRPAAQIQQVSPKFPGEILIGLNNRNPQYHDVYKVNVGTGKMELVLKNDQFGAVVTDDEFKVRLGIKPTPEGGQEFMAPDGKDGWTSFLTVKSEDSLTTQPAGFSKDGGTMYMISSGGRNTAALKAIDMASKAERVLSEDARADAGGAMVHPTEKTVQAVSFDYQRTEWKVLDKSIEGDLAYLRSVAARGHQRG